jgi:hypothetical protein
MRNWALSFCFGSYTSGRQVDRLKDVALTGPAAAGTATVRKAGSERVRSASAMRAVMVRRDRIRILQALLNRRVGIACAGEISALQSRTQRVQVLRQLQALEAGTGRAVSQSTKSLLGSGQIAGLESLRELLKLLALWRVRALQRVRLIQCAAGK